MNCFEQQKINFRIPLASFTSNIANLNNRVQRKLSSQIKREQLKSFKRLDKRRKVYLVLNLLLQRGIFCVEEESPYKDKFEKKKGNYVDHIWHEI